MGLISKSNHVISLKDERLADLLALHTEGKDVRLTPDSDRVWYDLALQSVDGM